MGLTQRDWKLHIETSSLGIKAKQDSDNREKRKEGVPIEVGMEDRASKFQRASHDIFEH